MPSFVLIVKECFVKVVEDLKKKNKTFINSENYFLVNH